MPAPRRTSPAASAEADTQRPAVPHLVILVFPTDANATMMLHL